MQIPGEKCREKLVGDSLALTSEVEASGHFCCTQLPGLQVCSVSPRGVTPMPPFWGSLNAAEELVGSPTEDVGGTPRHPQAQPSKRQAQLPGRDPPGAMLQEDTALGRCSQPQPASSEPNPLPSQETSRSCPSLQSASSRGNGVGSSLLPP